MLLFSSFFSEGTHIEETPTLHIYVNLMGVLVTGLISRQIARQYRKMYYNYIHFSNVRHQDQTVVI